MQNLAALQLPVSVQLTSEQDGIYALRKAHMQPPPPPPPSLRNSPNVAFETVLMFVCLTMAISFFQIRLSSASLSTPLSSRRSMVVTSLALCLQVVSQAPEHFKYSQKQATCEACFACQDICCYILSFQPMSSV